jgi:hypothetical protein
MKKVLSNLVVCSLALGFASAAPAATTEAKAVYGAAKDNATATYKMARAKCDALSANPKNVCIEEAKAAEKRSKAEAEAQYKNTPKAHMNARIAAADGEHAVAKAKCNDLSGNAKDVCIKEAKAVHTKAVVDAKANKEIRDIKSEARDEKHDADYKVALEKCDALAGATKEACIAGAKSKYGK